MFYECIDLLNEGQIWGMTPCSDCVTLGANNVSFVMFDVDLLVSSKFNNYYVALF